MSPSNPDEMGGGGRLHGGVIGMATETTFCLEDRVA